MSRYLQPLLILGFAPLFASMAMSQTAEPVRKYGVGLDVHALRNWHDEGTTINQVAARSAFLFLNHNLHFGPTASFQRIYGSGLNDSEWSVGLQGKWTYEDLQTADRTPFVLVGGALEDGKGSDTTSAGGVVYAALGYETFLNPFVSLAPSIEWSRSNRETTWSDKDTKRDHTYRAQTTGATFNFGLNVYL